MPSMNGFEASKVLKNDKRFSNIPIVALTASALKRDEVQISTVCDGYIRKPVSMVDLTRELMKFLPYREIGASADSAFPADIRDLEPEALPPESLEQLKKQLEQLELNTGLPGNGLKVLQLVKTKSFAAELERLGKSYNSTILSRFASRLQSHLKNLDLSAIQKDLEAYRQLKQHLTSKG